MLTEAGQEGSRFGRVVRTGEAGALPVAGTEGGKPEEPGVPDEPASRIH